MEMLQLQLLKYCAIPFFREGNGTQFSSDPK